MAIKIVTDSTADMPKGIIDKYGIIEMPLTVHFGDAEFRDRVDITPEEFFDRLVKSTALPTTSQVTPGAFNEIYKRELERGNSIISIHLSSELSGTYQSAMLAKQSLNDNRVHVIDSRSATLALGMIVLRAAELVQKGLDEDEIVREIETFKEKVKLFIVVDTLEYLKKGGRLSGTQAFIGSMLNIKPLLTIEDGKVVVIDRVRGQKKAMKRVIELMKDMGGASPVTGMANANCPDTVKELKALILQEFGDVEFIETGVGSVIATHVGPGAYGIVLS